jgi:hypothetical protein
MNDVRLQSRNMPGERQVGNWVKRQMAIKHSDVHAGRRELLFYCHQASRRIRRPNRRGTQPNRMHIPAVAHKGPTQQSHLCLSPAATQVIDNMKNSTGHIGAKPCERPEMGADSEEHLSTVGPTPE